MGMIPVYVLTGTPGKAFEAEIRKMLEEAGITGSRVKAEGDLFELQQWIKEAPVDLLIGTSYGKYIARAEDVPFVRFGFPILDRAVHPLMPVVGYRGCLRLIEQISNALLERRDRDCLDEALEKLSGRSLPDLLERERGWLLDGMEDSHKFNAAGRSCTASLNSCTHSPASAWRMVPSRLSSRAGQRAAGLPEC